MKDDRTLLSLWNSAIMSGTPGAHMADAMDLWSHIIRSQSAIPASLLCRIGKHDDLRDESQGADKSNVDALSSS